MLYPRRQRPDLFKVYGAGPVSMTISYYWFLLHHTCMDGMSYDIHALDSMNAESEQYISDAG